MTGIRVTRDCNWFWMDRRILDYGPNIGVIPFAVYTILCSYANGKSGSCYPTIKSIADRIAVSEKSVTRATQTLVECGLIRIDRRFNSSSVYHITPIKGGELQSPGDSQSLGGDSQSPGVGTHSPSNKININKNNLTSGDEVKTSPSTDKLLKPNKAVIDYFVAAYLKKTGKKYCFLPKDAKHISDLLKVTESDQITKRIDSLFASTEEFYAKAGYTVGVLYACFNKLEDKQTGLRV